MSKPGPLREDLKKDGYSSEEEYFYQQSRDQIERMKHKPTPVTPLTPLNAAPQAGRLSKLQHWFTQWIGRANSRWRP